MMIRLFRQKSWSNFCMKNFNATILHKSRRLKESQKMHDQRPHLCSQPQAWVLAHAATAITKFTNVKSFSKWHRRRDATSRTKNDSAGSVWVHIALTMWKAVSGSVRNAMAHITSFFTLIIMEVKAAGSRTRKPPTALANGKIHKIREVEIHRKNPTRIKR